MNLFLAFVEIDPQTLINFLERFGLPTGVLIAFAYFVAQSIRWFGANVVVPMKDRHISFLENLEKCLDKITDSQIQICDNTHSIRDDVDKITESQAVLKSESKIMKDKVEGLSSMVFQSMISNGKYDSKVMSQPVQEHKQ